VFDVAELLTDPDFSQRFTIQRATTTFVRGGSTSNTTPITVSGIIWIARSKDLQQVPEADRVLGAMVFACREEIMTTHAGDQPGPSDTITWRNNVYRIQSVYPYVDYGYYKAIGVRVSGK
jgi:hypothetical protein